MWGKQKSVVFQEWKRAIKQVKALRQARMKFEYKSAGIQLAWAVGRLFDFKMISKSQGEKKKLAFLNYLKTLNRRVFDEWKNIHLIYTQTRNTF